MSVAVAREDRVGIITLDRPAVNAFDEEQTARFAAAVAELGADTGIRALLIRGAGRHFCGGADIAMMASWRTAPDRRERLARFASDLQHALQALSELPKPSIAAITGAATGGGLELALACDFRIAGVSARLGLPEVGLGLLPGAGGTQRLTRIAGPAVATRLVLGAELVDGRQAAQLGIVHWTVDGDVEGEAMRHAHRLAALPPAAYGAAKRCIAAARGADGFAAEIDEIGRLIETDETARLLHRFTIGAR
ncbi:enoyl-CoA hydratase/isomerase family protein [Rhodococcus phenolicus]|uniref:enoyl-CoA hydratase/isomerase family protein n=1 Tax=Rhodococcus phenolicus TaxID=263849 RepID=UPI0008357681|nr:enoyl-CoA hydratase/isomerase family protein [Rhodococcus phenolicus]